jgi:ATP-dependent helicase/DNAse subunit B
LFSDKEPVPAGITYISANVSKIKSQRYDSKEESLKAATDEIKRSGLILDDEAVISAVSRSQSNRYLMATSRKRSTITRESLDMIYGQVCDILKSIGDGMLTGNANAVPKDGADTCKYCPYSHVCRASEKEKK